MVRHHDPALQPGHDLRDEITDRWRACDHLVRDVVHERRAHVASRVNQRRPLVEHRPSSIEPHDADLDDPVLVTVEPRRLDVERDQDLIAQVPSGVP